VSTCGSMLLLTFGRKVIATSDYASVPEVKAPPRHSTDRVSSAI